MTQIGKIKLRPLGLKHYDTQIEVEVGGDGWDEEGEFFLVSISGTGSKPSVREYEKGYYPEDGMDHVESQEHYELATLIMEALRKKTS